MSNTHINHFLVKKIEIYLRRQNTQSNKPQYKIKYKRKSEKNKGKASEKRWEPQHDLKGGPIIDR